MRRVATPELMDRAAADPVRVAESLQDLAGLNRYLGGTATILQQLDRLLGVQRRDRLRLLDVAAGGADILLALERWFEPRTNRFYAVAIDLGSTVVRRAAQATAESAVAVVRGRARALPFADRRFDVAICSTFLHHLDPEEAVQTLREMARVSEIGVVVSDLRRGRLAYIAASVLAETLWRRHAYTRHDARASMRSAYSLAEAQELARRAGLAATVEAQPAFRWALRWRRTD